MYRALFFLALFSVSTWAADTVTGTVRNATSNQPSAGDDVILLRLTEGMLQETATKTDAQGAFILKLEFPGAPHLVRVVHQGVNYDQQVTASTPVAVSVFDAVPKISEVRGSSAVVQLASQENMLEVSELYGVQNASNPPRTQTSQRNFDFHMPPGAELISVMVAAPAAKMGVRVEPAPVEGDQGHYTLNFPLKPGETRYFIKYRLPYDGRTAFHPTLPYPFQQFGVMVPDTMTFTPLRPNTFHDSDQVKGFRLYAASKVKAGPVPGFEIAGMLPPATGANPPLSTVQAPGANVAHESPATVIPAKPSNSEMWVMLAGCVVLGVVIVFMITRAFKKVKKI